MGESRIILILVQRITLIKKSKIKTLRKIEFCILYDFDLFERFEEYLDIIHCSYV